MKYIGIIALVVVLAKWPEEVKRGVDVASYFAKMTYYVGYLGFRIADNWYQTTHFPGDIEKMKSVSVDSALAPFKAPPAK